MTVPWQIVDLTSFEGRVSAGKGVLRVGERTVPLAEISVVLTGLKGEYHPSVFDRAAAFEIPLLHCDWRGIPIAATLSWNNGSRVAARHLAQANLDLARGKNAWMRIIKAKIRGQAANLKLHDTEGYKFLSAMSLKVRSGDPSNLEGQAARYYWTRFLDDATFRRQPGTRTEINGMLDYGYTILRGAAIRAVLSAGLWPTLGIWHHQRDNCFALADDIMEPFRPAVDALVIKITEDSSVLGPLEKRRLATTMNLPLKSSDYTVGTEITKLAQRLARYVEGETKVLEVPEFGGLGED